MRDVSPTVTVRHLDQEHPYSGIGITMGYDTTDKDEQPIKSAAMHAGHHNDMRIYYILCSIHTQQTSGTLSTADERKLRTMRNEKGVPDAIVCGKEI